MMKKALVSLLFAACGAAASFSAHAGTTFNFKFGNGGFGSSDGITVNSPVGTGTFVSPTDLAAGTYDLSSLSGFSLVFDFEDGRQYTTADIATPLTGVAVKITSLGGGVARLVFTEGSGAGADGGPAFGSLDLINSDSLLLSFEPSFAGGNYLYTTGGGVTPYSGLYVALGDDTPGTVPEPASLALIGLGLVGFAASRRKARKQ